MHIRTQKRGSFEADRNELEGLAYRFGGQAHSSDRAFGPSVGKHSYEGPNSVVPLSKQRIGRGLE